LSFPDKLYTEEQIRIARDLIAKGYKQNLKIEGSEEFVEKVKESLKLVEIAGYMDFVRSYIRRIVEKGGFSQLRESELTIWANKYTVSDPVEAASLWVQKAEQTRMYIEMMIHVGGEAEAKTTEKRIQFLRDLRDKVKDPKLKKRCEEKLKKWAESVLL